jgi:anthranilate/para-aminobenzoate synthase component I
VTVPSIAIQVESRELPFIAPFPAFLRLREVWGEGNVVLLESLSGPQRDVRQSLIGYGPVLTVSFTGLALQLSGRDAVVRHVTALLLEAGLVARQGDALAASSESDQWRVVRAIAQMFSCPSGGGTSFHAGFIGYLGYDVVRAFERLPFRITATDGQPTLVLTLFEGIVTVDLVRRQTRLLINTGPGFWTPKSAEETGRVLAEARALEGPDLESLPEVPRPRAVHRPMSHANYLEKVAKALHYIRIGDIYQVQLGHEIDVDTAAIPLDVYRRLRARNPSPYMYLLSVAGTTLVGASPESFLRIEAGQITMRPIAGTARRGKTPAEDAELVEKLRTDEKELAEHLMLVDLCRNDIGRVCKPGTLKESELFQIEQYSHVNHIVSNITGQLRDDVDPFAAIAATFPAGTMTGAPKIRAMEIIEELETTRRGAYAGAVGLIDFSGYVNMALCIRSTLYRDGHYHLRASAGAVADSVAENEWRETLHKMGVTYWAVTGEELKYESLSD